MIKLSGRKTSFAKQEKAMSNVVNFPNQKPIVTNEVDDQFIELEKQRDLIMEQRRLIENKKN